MFSPGWTWRYIKLLLSTVASALSSRGRFKSKKFNVCIEWAVKKRGQGENDKTPTDYTCRMFRTH